MRNVRPFLSPYLWTKTICISVAHMHGYFPERRAVTGQKWQNWTHHTSNDNTDPPPPPPPPQQEFSKNSPHLSPIFLSFIGGYSFLKTSENHEETGKACISLVPSTSKKGFRKCLALKVVFHWQFHCGASKTQLRTQGHICYFTGKHFT